MKYVGPHVSVSVAGFCALLSEVMNIQNHCKEYENHFVFYHSFCVDRVRVNEVPLYHFHIAIPGPLSAFLD